MQPSPLSSDPTTLGCPGCADEQQHRLGVYRRPHWSSCWHHPSAQIGGQASIAEQQEKFKQFIAGGQAVQPPIVKDSGERKTFSSGSVRDTETGKIKWSRITFGPMLRRWAQHLTTAEVKYPDVAPGVPNFTLIESEEEYFRYKESAFRHFMSWFFNETDEDHAAATFFNINGVEIIKAKRSKNVASNAGNMTPQQAREMLDTYQKGLQNTPHRNVLYDKQAA